MGGPELHPGSDANHIRQCDSVEDVRKKGRLEYMQAADFEEESSEDKAARERLMEHMDKYNHHKDMAK